jgi:cell division protein FtsL
MNMLIDTPLVRFVLWMADWSRLAVFALGALVVLSAMAVIYSAHATRSLYAELQAVEKNRDYLDSEYEKLLLEQGAWAGYSRVDQVSHEELKMSSPEAADIVVVTR